MGWKIEVEAMPSSSRVVVVFDGHLSTTEGRASASAFAEALANGRVDVTWDLSRMSDYDAPARLAWQEAIWPHRANVASLSIVGANRFVRVGARMLALFIGAPATFIDKR